MTCEKHSDKTALFFSNQKFSYAELNNLTHFVASALLRLNIQPNDKIAFYLANCPQAVLCFTACFKIGVTVVPINQYFNEKQLAHVLQEAQPKLLVSEKKLLPTLQKIPKEILNTIDCYFVDDVEDCSLSVKSFQSLIHHDHLVHHFAEVDPKCIATISYTSGTTGLPKGVVHTQQQLYQFIVNHTQIAKYSSHDRVLVCVPMAFAYSFSNQVLTSLLSGSSIALIPAGNYEEVIDVIQQAKITLLYIGPTTFIQLLKVLSKRPKLSHCLRAIVSAGDALPIALHKRAKQWFDVMIYEGIGMSEAWLYALNPLDESAKIGSLGLVCKDMQIKIVNDKHETLPAGHVGQIAIKGYSVMQGYYSATKTALALENGWFYTGDYGYLDEDDYIYYRGRKDSFVVKNGILYYPHEIEFALYEHPAVYEAGVVCEEDYIMAYVSLTDCSINEKDLLLHLKKYLASEKIPNEICILTQLPKGVTGKIDRKSLKQMRTAVLSPY